MATTKPYYVPCVVYPTGLTHRVIRCGSQAEAERKAAEIRRSGEGEGDVRVVWLDQHDDLGKWGG